MRVSSSCRRQLLLSLAYAMLLALGIPWYWPAADTRLVLGVPLWVGAALVTGLLASGLTAGLLLARQWPEPAARGPGVRGSGR